MTAPTSLIAMCRDSHQLMIEADANAKAHAAIRNASIYRLVTQYGVGLADVAKLTGIKDSTVRNVYNRVKGKA